MGIAYGAKASHEGSLWEQEYDVQILDLCATTALSIGVPLILFQAVGFWVYVKTNTSGNEWIPAVSTRD